MKKSDLNESIIGRRCVVYDGLKRIVGAVGSVKANANMARIDAYYGQDKHQMKWWHYKAVRLLKKKEAPVYWVHKDVLNEVKCGWNLWASPRDNYVKVKLVKIKDEK